MIAAEIDWVRTRHAVPAHYWLAHGYGDGTGYGRGTTCGSGSVSFAAVGMTNDGTGRGVTYDGVIDEGVGRGNACGSGTAHRQGQGKGR